MELEQQIEQAVMERGLREMLQREEKKIRAREQYRRLAVWSLSGGGITALAAAMLLLFTVVPMARQMEQYSTQYVAQIETGMSRGGDSYTAALNEAIRLMQQDRWDEASKMVGELFAQTAEDTDEQMMEIHDSAEWFMTICWMHEGKVRKAKDMLEKIADSDSYYNKPAKELLESL